MNHTDLSLTNTNQAYLGPRTIPSMKDQMKMRIIELLERIKSHEKDKVELKALTACMKAMDPNWNSPE